MKSKAAIQPFATKKIMADNSNEEETRSQRTRQLTRKKGSNRSYMEKCKTELNQYYFKEERYEEHKAKIFVIVTGQCTLNMNIR